MDEERLPKILMEWLPTERGKRGHPRETWKQGISKAMSERNLGPGDWNDRKEWKLGIGRRPHTLGVPRLSGSQGGILFLNPFSLIRHPFEVGTRYGPPPPLHAYYSSYNIFDL
ncbi:hypothetical protein J6590_024452 [Homalodisca vitripennis]|nr:hypothetical protein J6590_024452 [Homalodisca vitripennis]